LKVLEAKTTYTAKRLFERKLCLVATKLKFLKFEFLVKQKTFSLPLNSLRTKGKKKKGGGGRGGGMNEWGDQNKNRISLSLLPPLVSNSCVRLYLYKYNRLWCIYIYIEWFFLLFIYFFNIELRERVKDL
jgi:hypothetical protein